MKHEREWKQVFDEPEDEYLDLLSRGTIYRQPDDVEAWRRMMRRMDVVLSSAQHGMPA